MWLALEKGKNVDYMDCTTMRGAEFDPICKNHPNLLHSPAQRRISPVEKEKVQTFETLLARTKKK